MTLRLPAAFLGIAAIFSLAGCEPSGTARPQSVEKTIVNADKTTAPDTTSAPDVTTETDPKLAKATFGGGCFWCVEAVFERIPGVKSAVSGYAGGKAENPSYALVCTGLTGHAEVVQVAYDPAVASFDDLLDAFWQAHDPTTLNSQGPDHGTQYRSVIFYHDDAQKEAALKSIAALNASGRLASPVVTEVVPLTKFYPAEANHQDYYRNNSNAPYCRMMIAPKLDKLKVKAKDAPKS
jgi:peptide-methionine (S)-S-oxide reductase